MPNNGTTAPSITLSQQALQIYDLKGEFAMLPFAMNNVYTSENVPHDWETRGYCLLDDGSDITHYNGKYLFGWHNREKETHAERFSAMPEHGRPTPTKTHDTPVMKWPNRAEVWNAVADVVEHRSDMTEECVFTEPDVSYRISPSLYHAISNAIEAAETSDFVQKYADNICSDIAAAAVLMIQPDELQALIDHATNADKQEQYQNHVAAS